MVSLRPCLEVGSLQARERLQRLLLLDKFESESNLQNLIAEQNPSSTKLQPFFLSTFRHPRAFVAKLAQRILPGPSSKHDLPLKEGLCLYATMISIYEKEFIRSTTVEESDSAGVKIPSDVIEINFVRSFSGICTLRFVGIYGER